MAVLSILKFPDPRLKLEAKLITGFDSEIEQLYNNLLETMYTNDGVGLAATQVDIQLSIFVIDISEKQNSPICFINPKIVASSGEITYEEGCLSFPGVYAKVKRFADITLEYQDLRGNKQQAEATDLEAICLQHELDHLNGITFFDHLSPLKQRMLKKKYMKQRDIIV